MISKTKIILVGFIIIQVLHVSCHKKQDDKTSIPRDYKQKLEEINKVLLSKDTENIQQFIKRRGWQMQTTQSGLWFMIYSVGNSEKVAKNDLIELKYKLWLIDGSFISSSDSSGLKSFRVSQGGVEPGLEEGVLMMNKGSKARFILPPHLAHGVVGDGDKIPGRAILVYDVEVIDVK
ncbi:MAG: FKBP-type peptidyl-prolyl cis-trans isomerase [Bacteroidales bacterium]